jgi:hypothetical protein
MTAEWSHSVYTCILLFIQMNVVPSGVWKMLPRMNQTDSQAVLGWMGSDAAQLLSGLSRDVRVEVRALALSLKDIQRLVLKPLLHCLGFCILSTSLALAMLTYVSHANKAP